MHHFIHSIYQQFTEQNVVKAEDDRASSQQQLFLRQLNHKIRTPMHNLYCIGEMLMASGLNDEQYEHVHNMMQSADDVMLTLNDMTDCASLHSDALQICPINFNLHSACDDIAAIFAPRAHAKHLDLMVRYVPDTPEWVCGDVMRIRQILYSLLDNAIRFTSSGYVLIKVEQIASNDDGIILALSVEDTGQGMNNTLSEAIQHGGYGLALSDKLTQAMEGTLHVKTIPEQGSTFTLSLPLKIAKAGQEKLIDHSILHDKHVLIVDDLRDNRTLLCEQLAQTGMVCHQAASAREALAILDALHHKGTTIDILLIDYLMPETDGKELTSTLSSSTKFIDIPILILSSAGDGYAKQFMEAGAQGFLTKPLRLKELLHSCTMLLQAQQNHQTPSFITRYTIRQAYSHAEPPIAEAKISNVVPIKHAQTYQNSQFLDNEILQASHHLMGEKLRTIIEYYLEDSMVYLENMQKAADDYDSNALSHAAHTLKSASQQLGLMPVGYYANTIENMSSKPSTTIDWPAITSQLAALNQCYEHSIKALYDWMNSHPLP